LSSLSWSSTPGSIISFILLVICNWLPQLNTIPLIRSRQQVTEQWYVPAYTVLCHAERYITPDYVLLPTDICNSTTEKQEPTVSNLQVLCKQNPFINAAHCVSICSEIALQPNAHVRNNWKASIECPIVWCIFSPIILHKNLINFEILLYMFVELIGK
jgi:hypothetical protein